MRHKYYGKYLRSDFKKIMFNLTKILCLVCSMELSFCRYAYAHVFFVKLVPKILQYLYCLHVAVISNAKQIKLWYIMIKICL